MFLYKAVEGKKQQLLNFAKDHLETNEIERHIRHGQLIACLALLSNMCSNCVSLPSFLHPTAGNRGYPGTELTESLFI